MNQNSEIQQLTPDQLRTIGIALFGKGFKIQLADYLGVDRRRINHWLDGDRPIPSDTGQKLLELVKVRSNEINNVMKMLESL
ncbi:hypothetical protein [Acinetobacter colistiniresistens]|uniref:hypothetical protein n=1 Tax=Acinetobacter colistiniresistens TaxID=280145 RepID=UPI001250BC7A|nr:hypothetical protein [Acinetobacter colistiniresistens]